jgi:hypothetical protein
LWLMASRPVCLGVKPHPGPRMVFCYCQTVGGLFMRGALTDERKSLSFTIAAGPHQRIFTTVGINSTCHLCLQFYMLAFYIVICQESGSLWTPNIYSFTCNSSIYVYTVW